MKTEYIPAEAKCGVIITIPKTGKKQLNRRENYRGITLLSALYKLFKLVLLSDKTSHMTLLSKHLPSHAITYQTGLCSLMTSFVLQETVNYNAERGSKTYCCMLDAAAAFDTVLHDGLFFKIYNSGINGRLWRVLRSAYKHF